MLLTSNGLRTTALEYNIPCSIPFPIVWGGVTIYLPFICNLCCFFIVQCLLIFFIAVIIIIFIINNINVSIITILNAEGNSKCRENALSLHPLGV